MSKYAFGYILVGFAFLAVIVISYAKRRIFLKKVGSVRSEIDRAESRLRDILGKSVWREPAFLGAANLMLSYVRWIREGLREASSFLDAGDPTSVVRLKKAKHDLRLVNSVLEIGILDCFGGQAAQPARPKPPNQGGRPLFLVRD